MHRTSQPTYRVVALMEFMLAVRVKVWLECDGETVMSEGRAALLAEIDRVGSLSAAAKNLHMSYKHARNLIDSLQGRGSAPIVISTRGGHSRGGTVLTEYGRTILETYHAAKRDLEAHAAHLSEK